MPYEFKDLSKQVSKGAKLVDKELLKMVVNTVKVDKAQKKLTKTQKSALQISDKYRKSLKLLNKEFVVLKKTSLAASKGLTALSDRKVMYRMTGLAATVEDLKDSLKELSKIKASVSVDVRGVKEVKTFREAVEGVGKDTGVDRQSKHLGEYGKQARHAGNATKDLIGHFDKFHDEVVKVQGVTGLLAERFKDGARDVRYFGDGIGLSQNRMIAAGAAAFFLLQKAGDLVGSFKDARMELARFNVDLARAGKATLGVDASQLRRYKDELSLTRDQASRFFDALKDGSSSGVISIQEMVNAAGNLQKAFGGDPTQRLQDYVDLLKEIPTLDADLKVTASLDDQAASLFDLARKGKISTVIELQQAGLLGGIDITAMSPTDVKLLNSNQKTEKFTEDIRDYLLNKLFPSFGPQLSAISEHTFKALALIGGAASAAGVFNAFFIRRQGQQIRATERVEHAVWMAGVGKGRGRIPGKAGTVLSFHQAIRSMKDAFAKGFTRGGGGAGGLVRGAKGAATALTRGLFLASKNSHTAARGMKSLSGAMNIATKGFSRAGLALRGIAGPAALIGLALDAAGVAADFLSRNLETKGDKLGSSLTKMYGAHLKATASILTFTAAGATLGTLIAGPLGTAVGAAAGAFVGISVAVWNNLEEFGTAMESFGKELNGTVIVAGKPIRKYAGIVGDFGIALEETGGVLTEWSKEIKISTREYTAIAWEGIKTIPQLYNEVTTLSGWFAFASKRIQEMIRESAFKEAFKDSAELMGKASKSTKNMAVLGKEFEELWVAAQNKTMQSALALERQFNATAAVAKTGKVELAGFQREVAGLDIEMLSQAGGSAAQFSDAVSASSDGIRTKFKELMKGYATERKNIAAREKLSAADRKAQLLDVYKKELDARKEFTNAMSELVESIMKTPKLIGAKLRAELSATKMGITTGALGLDEFESEMKTAASNVAAAMEETARQSVEAQARIREREETKAEVEKRVKEVTPERLKGGGGRIKKEFEGVFDIGEEEGKDVVKGVKNAELARENLKKLRDEQAKLTKAYDELAEEAKMAEVPMLARTVAKMSDSIKVAQGELDVAVERLNDMGKSESERKTAQEEITAKHRVIQELTTQQEKAQRELAKQYGRLGLTTEVAKDALMKALAVGNMAPIKDAAMVNVDSSKEAARAYAELIPLMGKANEAMRKRNKIKEQIDEKEKDAAILTAASTDLTDLTNQNIRDQGRILKEVEDRQREAAELMEKAENYEHDLLWAAKKRVGTLKAESVMAKLSGRDLENFVEISKAELRLYDDVRKATKVKIDTVRGIIDKHREFLEKTPGLPKDVVNAIKKQIGDYQMQIIKFKETSDKAKDAIVGTFYGIGDAIDLAAQSFQGKEAQFKIDLSAAQLELAEFSSDAKEMAAKATAEGRKGLEERLKIERKYIEEATVLAKKTLEGLPEAERERLNTLLAEGRITEDQHRLKLKEFEEAWPQLRAARERTIETQHQLEMTQSETKYKKEMVKSAEDSQKIKRAELDIAEGVLNVQMEYAQASGAAASVILGYQKQGVDIERQKWESAIATLEAAKQDEKLSKDSVKMAELSAAVTTAELRMKMKSIGVQRDMMEKVIGSALGEIRTSVGARKQRGTDVGLMGMEATRAKGPSGMYQKAGPGGVKSYQQRLAELRVGGKEDRGAERIRLEREMAEKLRGTKAATEKTATATGNMDQRSSTAGSLFTHDTYTEKLLTSLLASVKSISDGVWVIANKTGGTGGTVGTVTETTTADVKTKMDTAMTAAAAKADLPNPDADSEYTPAPKWMDEQTALLSSIAARKNAVPRSDGVAVNRGTMYEPTNPPAGVAGGGTAKVEGKITVHFDSAAFRDEVADVVGRIIQTPEIQKSLQKTGHPQMV